MLTAHKSRNAASKRFVWYHLFTKNIYRPNDNTTENVHRSLKINYYRPIQGQQEAERVQRPNCKKFGEITHQLFWKHRYVVISTTVNYNALCVDVLCAHCFINHTFHCWVHRFTQWTHASLWSWSDYCNFCDPPNNIFTVHK